MTSEKIQKNGVWSRKVCYFSNEERQDRKDCWYRATKLLEFITKL